MNLYRQGFTLIELLIALSIVAIVLGTALPGYRHGMDAVHASTARTTLFTAILTASRQSFVNGSRTVMCPSSDGSSCLPKSADWSLGWIVFQDRNGDRERSGDESVLQQQSALARGVHLHSTAGRTRIVFQGNGGNAGSNVTFTLCDGRGPAKAQSLVLNNQGRLRTGTPTTEALATTCQP